MAEIVSPPGGGSSRDVLRRLHVGAGLFGGLLASCLGVSMAAPIGSRPAPGAAADRTTRPAEVVAATEKFQAGDVEAAWALLKAAGEVHTGLAPPRVMLANLYFSAGQLAAARRELERAAIEHPSDPEAYLSFADLALRAGRWTDAESLYARGGQLLDRLESQPERQRRLSVRYHAGQAGVAEARQQWKLAEQALERWLALEPASPQVHLRLAAAAAWQGRAEQAEARFRQAHELDGQLPPVPLAMGEQYRRQGDAAAARRWLERAVATLPADVRPRVALARLLWEQGSWQEAAAQAAAGVNLAPDSEAAWLIQGIVARYLGEHAQAVASLERVLDAAPDHFLAVDQLALVLCEQSDPPQRRRAVQLAEQNRRQHPGSLTAVATLGWVYLQTGGEEQADRLLGQLANAQRTDPNQSFYLAAWHARRGRPAEAAAELRRAGGESGPFAYAKAAAALGRTLEAEGGSAR